MAAPTILEIYSLIDFTKSYPAIDQAAFPSTPDKDFWSSTSVAGSPSLARYANFELGDTNEVSTSFFGRVRCVKGFSTAAGLPAPKCYPAGGRYSGSATEVSDGKTGLTWQRGVAPNAKTWSEAVAYCSTLGGGFRLPSIKELLTIVDFNKTGVAIDANFTGTTAANFWSSTANLDDASYAMLIHFGNGGVGVTAKTVLNEVRCVK